MQMRDSLSHDLFVQLRRSFQQPEFWAYSSWLDIVIRYRRSRLGVLWMLLPPLLYVGGIGYFYGRLMGADLSKFIPHMGIGYVMFRMAAMVINESASVLAGHQSFILDGHVRLTDFVLRVLAKALFYFCAALPVVLVAVAMDPQVGLAGALLSVAGLVLAIVNLLWIGLVVSLIGARYPDTYELMGSIFIFAFIVTPILWSADLVPADSMRGQLIRANPLYHLIEIVRAPLLGEPLDPSTPSYVLVMTLAGWAIAWLCYRRYARFVPLWI